MRLLHAVAYHEQFVASGQYLYERGGQPAGIVEAWSIHQLPDQNYRVRVDKDAREADAGTSLLLEALLDVHHHVQRFDLHLYNPNAATMKIAKSTYTFIEGSVQIGWQSNDEPRDYHEMTLPDGVVIYPLMQVFTGWMIRQMIENGGEAVPVFMPRFDKPDDEQALSGFIETCSAWLVGTENLPGTEAPARLFRFVGGMSDENTAYWLDQHDMLVACAGGNWRMTLKNYARRPHD